MTKEIKEAFVKFKKAYNTHGLQDFITFCLNENLAELDTEALNRKEVK